MIFCDKCGDILPKFLRTNGVDYDNYGIYAVVGLVQEEPGDSIEDYFVDDTLGVYCAECIEHMWE